MGTVVISLDAELGWGFHDEGSPPMDRIERARWGWNALLDLFDQYDVPATWAVVGHLMLNDCDGYHDGHPLDAEWFERERGAWRDHPEFLFAPDLVERIVDAKADHELASHSFSHVEFGKTTREVARAELELSLAAAEPYGVSLRTFIHPRRDIGHQDVIAECGFDCYRGRQPVVHSRRDKVLQVIRSGEPLLVEPTVDEYGLVNVPESLYLFGFEDLARTVVEPVFGDPIARQAITGIDAAATADGVFHMWLHPNNVTEARDVARMETILSYLDQHRDTVEIATMGAVADAVRYEGRTVA